MNVCYLGAVWMKKLGEEFQFDKPLPQLKRDYPFGTNLAVGLAKSGHHITIVVFSINVSGIVKYSSSQCDVYIVHERRSRYQLLTLYSEEVAGLCKVIAKVKPDVVLANWTYQYARAGVISGFPCLVVARDSPWRCLWRMHSLTFLVKALYSQFLVFPKIKHLSTISPHMAGDLRRFNRYKEEVKIIPNGIKIDEGFKKDIRQHAKTILCVSEWNPLKNLKTLFRAFAIIRQYHPEWKLLAIGNGVEDSIAGAWMRKHGISQDGIELLGRKTQSEIKELLRHKADLFCSPTLEESFGQVFLEAMSQGVPCVGGKKSGAVPWVLGDGGVVCDVSNPEALSMCIESLMKNYEQRKRLSVAGRTRVKEMFTIENVADLYETELRHLSEC